MKLVKTMKTISAAALVAAASMAVAQPAYNGLGANGLGVAVVASQEGYDAAITYNMPNVEFGLTAEFLKTSNDDNVSMDMEAFGVEVSAGYKHNLVRNVYASIGMYAGYTQQKSGGSNSQSMINGVSGKVSVMDLGVYLETAYTVTPNFRVIAGLSLVDYSIITGGDGSSFDDQKVHGISVMTSPYIGVGYTFHY